MDVTSTAYSMIEFARLVGTSIAALFAILVIVSVLRMFLKP